jgi:hypothetical protein
MNCIEAAQLYTLATLHAGGPGSGRPEGAPRGGWHEKLEQHGYKYEGSQTKHGVTTHHYSGNGKVTIEHGPNGRNPEWSHTGIKNAGIKQNGGLTLGDLSHHLNAIK